MRVFKPFSAAVSAFRANAPGWNCESNFITKYLASQLQEIKDNSSFSLKDLKTFEEENINSRPKSLTYQDAIESVIPNREIALHKSEKRFLRSHIPAAETWSCFAAVEFAIICMCSEVAEPLWYTGLPAYIFAHCFQYGLRQDVVSQNVKKLNMAMELKKLISKHN
jgi:hypothetical protein